MVARLYSCLHTEGSCCDPTYQLRQFCRLVRLAKNLADIHAEATPHHFTLTMRQFYLWYLQK